MANGRLPALRLASVAALALVAAVVSPAAAAVPDGPTLARMDRVIEDGMGSSGMPGFAVAVVSGGDVVHARGFGDAGGGRRVTPQTPFVLGSTAKSFTALAAMQLVDAGRLELDAPARRYVPEFRLADQRAADRITVRQVLQQTTGLPETAGGPVVRSAADGTALEALRELGDASPAAAPGDAFEYSNGNFILAGLIVERASGQPYGEYVQRHIFAPLGMRNSYVALDAAQRAGLATGHRYWFGFSQGARTHLPCGYPVRGLPHLLGGGHGALSRDVPRRRSRPRRAAHRVASGTADHARPRSPREAGGLG